MVLISELLDYQRDALKVKEGEMADLRRGMEELSAARKAAIEEICQLKEDLCHEVRARSSREEELVQLGKSWEKGVGDIAKGLRAATERVCTAGCAADVRRGASTRKWC